MLFQGLTDLVNLARLYKGAVIRFFW